MAHRNAEVAELLRELAELTVLDEQSPQSFRLRAYENASRAVASWAADVAEMSQAELVKLDGIGKSTAQKIREYLDSGRMAKLEKLRAAYPPGVVALSQSPGVGPKAVAKLRAELGVESLEDLRAALAEQAARSSEPQKDELPRAIAEEDLIGDLHVHTSLSGDGRGAQPL